MSEVVDQICERIEHFVEKKIGSSKYKTRVAMLCNGLARVNLGISCNKICLKEKLSTLGIEI